MTAVIEDIGTTDRSITFGYSLDGERHIVHLEYESMILADTRFKESRETYCSYLVSLGILLMARFGSIIPRRFDITKYSRYVHPELLTFLRKFLSHHWSEHRYQIGRLDYYVPEFLLDESVCGLKVHLPLFKLNNDHVERVLVASGSGKDSLLCTQLLTAANVEYETFTYLHDVYGDIDYQSSVFKRLPQGARRRHHVLRIHDEYPAWLENRLRAFDVRRGMEKGGVFKPFRREAGEVFVSSFAMVPIQVVSGIPLQVFGHEKSADFPNLIDKETGESIAHQFAKSIYGETAIFNLYKKLFSNIQRVSLTKPIHDVRVFKTLFALAGDFPYLTNSCNVAKPWCGRCEKCLYVFSGFCAFGDYKRAVQTFNGDLFDNAKLLPVWEDLLGLNGRIPWECVGHPEETQLYFYKALQDGATGCVIDMFTDKIIEPLTSVSTENVTRHFATIEEKYSRLDMRHHHMPDWLAQKIFAAISEP